MSAPGAWRAIVLSLLAGLGMGYFIGLITAHWLWRRRQQSPPSSSSSSSLSSSQQATPGELAVAIRDLAAQVSTLSTIVSSQQQQQQRANQTSSSRQSNNLRGIDSMSDFVSARGESDDEFFDMDNDTEDHTASARQHSTHTTMEELDELGKATLESKEVCQNLQAELTQLLKQSPNDPALLWRLARALVHLSMHCAGEDVEVEKELLVNATEHAQRALELDDTVWQSHQWYAVALGSQMKHEPIQRKITVGHEYKEHIDTAISLHSSEPTLYYLRGQWSYNVAGLSWWEKKAASALYATPPEATYSECLEDVLRAEELRPGVWKANMLLIAKCYIKMEDISTAVEWLRNASQLAVVTTEDKTAQKEIEKLMETHLTES